MNKQKIKTIQLAIILIIASSNICGLFGQTLPTATSTLFSGSGNCAVCHIAGNGVFTTQKGTDISPTTLWRSTMMANAARDPLWQAKVSAEVIEHPLLQSVIEDKCTTCHSPMGRTEAIYNGAEHFSFQEALTDPLSLDGVSCTLCHQIQETNLGTDDSFSGGYDVRNIHKIFGPYMSPITTPMFNQTGYIPVHAEHVNNSELCATCHTLFTPFVDNQGQVAGYFPEQTPYLEWKNSIYPSKNTECQSCHMPATDEAMKIAIRPPWLTTQRSPIWEHDFVGGNVFINKMIKIHGAEIGVTASETQFDSTIFGATRLLQNTINLSAEVKVIEDTLNVTVQIENLSGHKFPTGFPSRRAWLHVIIKNSKNETIFESGKSDNNGEISGLDNGYEPHHDVISSQDQVQIYQSIMKDVDGNVTYTLLRGAQYAKDNRLTPKGFTTSATEYESIKICGEAANDNNFNQSDGIEGLGSDQIHYKYSVAGKGTEFFVTVQMLYQTVAPQFAQDLFSHETDNIAKFKDYYDSSDKSPILLKSLSLNVVNTGIHYNNRETQPAEFGLLTNYPNPFNPSTRICFEVSKSGHIILKVFNILGDEIQTLINDHKSVGAYEVNFNATHLPSGIYFCKMESGNEIKTKKILLVP